MQGIIRKVIAAGAMCLLGTTHASVVMNGTRYVYPSDAREITVKVSNVGKLPALTQAWIDDGDAKSTPESVDVPFNLTPPIARLEAGKSQTLRLAYTGSDLPGDRESQFWINILEVPPKPTDSANRNTMQLAIRYRLKLFFRPANLKGSPEAAPATLRWTRDGEGLSVTNPSAFHVTFNDVAVVAGGAKAVIEPFSVAPGATVTVKPHDAMPSGDELRIDYKYINDFGGFVDGSKRVGAP
ncbi:fimbria/pilus periplasmic chaperone [Luteibacter sp. 329MFSha]|uniref:fimbrial biogenesis chaperone n=1 Tax=Luteibacter sp. 329MFSha TaxID=1798239 RepID=UPI0008D1E3C5|nr:fimbria/pilus periplasmic chaperone [Luteibacter sp. 329MFSha]SEW28544.1 P pilus assembly protein, chaperone PapD [Luteibacter sp. 329MFSha]